MNISKEIILHNETEIRALVGEFKSFLSQFVEVIKNEQKDVQKVDLSAGGASSVSSVVVALSGDLGAGKTTFTKALAKSMGIQTDLSSPTFVIMKRYPIPKLDLADPVILDEIGVFVDFDNLIHIDAYRLEEGKDLEKLNFHKLMNNSSEKNIICIEWPEIVADILPDRYISIRFDHLHQNDAANTESMRKVTLELKM